MSEFRSALEVLNELEDALDREWDRYRVHATLRRSSSVPMSERFLNGVRGTYRLDFFDQLAYRDGSWLGVKEAKESA